MSSSNAGAPNPGAPFPGGPFPDLSQLSGDLYRQWEKSMTSWWDQVVDSPAFLGGMSKQVGQLAEARGRYEEAVDESLERLHLPTRKDVIRLARVCTLLEERLLSQEDLILGLQDRMEGLEREVLQARVEAAEARLEARERLEALSAALGTRIAEGVNTSAAADPEAPKASKRRGGASHA